MPDLSRPSSWVLPLLAGVALAWGCVPGAELRPSQAQAKRGPPARVDGASAGALVLDPPASKAATGAGLPVAPSGQRWVRGYWHWDGVRYVYVPARLERIRLQAPVSGAPADR